jgi:hypothetical protein
LGGGVGSRVIRKGSLSAFRQPVLNICLGLRHRPHMTGTGGMMMPQKYLGADIAKDRLDLNNVAEGWAWHIENRP